MIIDFLVLACSFKNGGRCVAGIDLSEKYKVKPFVRLVSKDVDSDYAIPVEDCLIDGKNEIQPLDIIKVDLLAKMPSNGAQTENYIADLPLVKQFVGREKVEKLPEFVRPAPNGFFYPFDTKDPFLSVAKYKSYTHYSLQLVRAYNVNFYKKSNSMGDSKTKISFDIYVGNTKVTLSDYSVTDPNYYITSEGINNAKVTHLSKAYLLISLGPSNDSSVYYKFVSGIIDSTNK